MKAKGVFPLATFGVLIAFAAVYGLYSKFNQGDEGEVQTGVVSSEGENLVQSVSTVNKTAAEDVENAVEDDNAVYVPENDPDYTEQAVVDVSQIDMTVAEEVAAGIGCGYWNSFEEETLQDFAARLSPLVTDSLEESILSLRFEEGYSLSATVDFVDRVDNDLWQVSCLQTAGDEYSSVQETTVHLVEVDGQYYADRLVLGSLVLE